MFYMLIGLILLVVLYVVLFCFSSPDIDDEWYKILTFFAAVFLSIITSLLLIVYCCMIWGWQASIYKASIVNRKYGTNYTREEIFYAGGVIEEIRQLDRKRIELNGDLLKDKE